jgi:hypothetical protein
MVVPASANAPHIQPRWQLTPIGRGQPDCLTSIHALGLSHGFVFSSRSRYTVTFLIYAKRLPTHGKVDVYVSSVSGDGYGGNSDYGGYGACPVKRIKLDTVRVRHHVVTVIASTSWRPVDAAVYVSVKPAHRNVPWSYATSAVFYP